MFFDVIEEPLQRRETARTAQQPAVHTDRQHLRRFVTLCVQDVERVAQVMEEVVRRVEALRRGKAHVVGIERVRHHKVRLDVATAGLHLRPERQVVAIVVGVVHETALLHDETTRIRTVAAGVPTQRRATRHFLEDVDGDAHVLTLGRLVHVLIVNPAPAVTRNLVPKRLECRRHLRVTLHGHCHAKHGQRQASTLELAQDAPHARARTVFIDGFHAHVTGLVGGRANDLGQELLGRLVTVQYTVLAALFVIQHELDGNARTSRPVGKRYMSAVADKVAGIILGIRVAAGHDVLASF